MYCLWDEMSIRHNAFDGPSNGLDMMFLCTQNRTIMLYRTTIDQHADNYVSRWWLGGI